MPRRSLGILSIIALTLAAGAQSAPAPPATVTIQPHWQAGQVLRWRLTIHSTLTRDAEGQSQTATLDNHSLAQMKIVSASPDGAVAELSVLSYKTDVSGLDAVAGQLRADEDKLSAAAPTLAPLRVRIVNGGENQILSAPQGSEYAEIVNMLEQLARTDTLPAGATRVGDQWTRQRVQKLETLHFSLPTTLRCALRRLDWTPGGWQAEISVTTSADSALPPSSIPNFTEFAQQGYAAKATLNITGTATAKYQVATGMLASASSETHNLFRIELTGPQPQPIAITTRIDSTGTVEPAPAPGGAAH